MTTNLMLKFAKSAYLPTTFVAMAFWNGLVYRNSGFKRFSWNDPATSYKNLVKFTPVTLICCIFRRRQNTLRTFRTAVGEALQQSAAAAAAAGDKWAMTSGETVTMTDETGPYQRESTTRSAIYSTAWTKTCFYIRLYNTEIIDITSPLVRTRNKYFRSLSFSKIWLESRMLCST